MSKRFFLMLLVAVSPAGCAGTDTPHPGAYPPGQTMATPQPGGASMGTGL